MSAEEHLGIHLATVNGESLTQALRQLYLTPGRKMGCGFFHFGEDMEIEWSGTRVAVEGEVLSQLPHDIMVPLKLMQQATEHLNYKGPTDVSWEKGILCVGSNRIPGEEAPIERPFALAAGSTDQEVLRAVLAWPGEEAFKSGYREELIEVGKRLEKSLDQAGEALAWTGLGEKLFTPMVLEALKAQAKEYRRLCESGDIDRISDESTNDQQGPRWEFPSSEDHIDLIQERRTGLVYLYRWNDLDRQGLGGLDLQEKLFQGLADLGEQNKRLRNRAFTVFVGDYGSDLGGYALALSSAKCASDRSCSRLKPVDNTASHRFVGRGASTCQSCAERCRVPSGAQVAGSRLGYFHLCAVETLGAAPPALVTVTDTE